MSFKAHEPKRSATARNMGVRTLAWSPKGDRLASGGLDGSREALGPDSWRRARPHARTPSYVSAVAWSPDGKRLASSGVDGLVIAWDAETGQRLPTMRGHTTLGGRRRLEPGRYAAGIGGPR